MISVRSDSNSFEQYHQNRPNFLTLARVTSSCLCTSPLVVFIVYFEQYLLQVLLSIGRLLVAQQLLAYEIYESKTHVETGRNAHCKHYGTSSRRQLTVDLDTCLGSYNHWNHLFFLLLKSKHMDY
jgi:hypothetical protein